MIKIGFDAKRLFNNFTGLGNYSRTLVQNLNTFFPKNQYYLFTPKTQHKPDTQSFLNKPYNIIKPTWQPKSIWRSIACTKQINKLNLQIYHGLSHELPIGIKKTGAKSLVTIHDLIYKTYPNDFKAVDRKIYDYKFRYACENADKIIAISKSTKTDLETIYNIPSEKIEVVYQSCHQNFKTLLNTAQIIAILSQYKLPNKYMLYVGSIIERKNLLGIVKALKKIKGQIKIPLVVVGKGKAYQLKVQKYVTENNLEKQVIFTSHISYFDLPAIYQNASLFIYPSNYEGFGIPIIEALWSKTPVITSNISSLPEAAGPGAFYCNPNDENTIANGIIKIIDNADYSTQLITNGFEHVRQFENDINTEKMMQVYKSLVND